MFETWYKMASLLQSGLKLEPIITHHFRCRTISRASRPWIRPVRQVILDWSTL